MKGKRQRGLASHDEGLSAVLAVMMLIGVAVLLAVALTLMIMILIQDQPESAPAIAFEVYEDEARWVLTTSPTEIPWSRYEMRALGASSVVKVRLNGEAGTTGFELTPTHQVLPTSSFPGDLTGGQYLDFCVGANEPDVRVIMVHSKSETVAHQYDFWDMPADPACV